MLLIATELSDPRLDDAMVAVTDVPCRRICAMRACLSSTCCPIRSTRNVLSGAAALLTFLRRALVENLHLRVVPELHFLVDETEKRAQHIDEILDQLARAGGGSSRRNAGSSRSRDHADGEQLDAR